MTEKREPGVFDSWQSLQIRAIAAVGWILVWAINLTVRYQTEDEEEFTASRLDGRPIIFAFWHNQIFCNTYYFRFQGITVITSSHFDGEYIGRIIENFGFKVIRGSSTRGGVHAALESKRHLLARREVAFTVDGPRGPRYVAKPGPVFLARKTGATILTLHAEPKKFWELNSWDGFRIPKPFTRVLIKCGNPMRFSSGRSGDEALGDFQKELDRLREYCNAYWQGTPNRVSGRPWEFAERRKKKA
jgi:lysophospholipid acyltransferase (LPLAT)-like uncharacterized protein